MSVDVNKIAQEKIAAMEESSIGGYSRTIRNLIIVWVMAPPCV